MGTHTAAPLAAGVAGSTAQMTTALTLSANTVRGHVRTLRRKLAAPDRDGLVDRARTLGLL
jgi:DNA-binding CsgD family transcriptional regulator